MFEFNLDEIKKDEIIKLLEEEISKREKVQRTKTSTFFKTEVVMSEKPSFIKKYRSHILNIPILGKLLWWIYMIIMSPRKINELYNDALRDYYGAKIKNIDTLIDNNKDLNLEIKKLSLEMKDIKISSDTLEDKLKELHREINELKSEVQSMKKHFYDWGDFYEKEITPEDMHGNINHHKYFIELLIKYANKLAINDIPKLLEVGIGTGSMSIYLSKRSFNVVGIDKNLQIIAKAIETNKRLGGYVKFIYMDAFDLPKFFKKNGFDIAFSQGTLEHFDNESLKSIIEAQLAVSKLVIFSIPSIHYVEQDLGNERKMDLEEWRKILQSFGFTIEEISYYQEGNSQILCVISKKCISE